jgi:hypothetical protein
LVLFGCAGKTKLVAPADGFRVVLPFWTARPWPVSPEIAPPTV